MVTSRWFLLSAALALLAGCGGPELIVEVLPERPAKVYFRGVRDGAGNELPRGGETFIGDAPTEWEIPENLLDGHGALKVDFGGGRTNEVYDFRILKDRDTVIRVSPPPVVK